MNPVEAMMQREIERLTAENTQLKKDYTRIQESATLWHDRYKTKCQGYMDRQAALGAEIVALEAERDALAESDKRLREALAQREPEPVEEETHCPHNLPVYGHCQRCEDEVNEQLKDAL